jgi:ATP-dependent exoDNAse (exonuclease V) beta subunit
MTATMTDQHVRDRVTDDLDTTLFVEAGAGTGKTTALVTRVIRLVGGGAARLRELAAITFTEAAAAELRERIGAALEQGAADPELPAEVRARLAAALDEVDLATISTLHGFAQRILTAHAVEAGLPPRLRIHDETASAVAFEERWRRFLDELLGTPEREAVIVQARLCGLGLDALRELARSFDTNWDLVVDHVPPRPSPLGPVQGRRLRELLCQARAAEDRCTHEVDALLRHLTGLHPFVEELEATPDGLPLLSLLRDAPKLATRRGNKAHWHGGCDDIRDLLQAAQLERERLTLTAGREALAHLVVELRDLTLEAASARRASGVLDFHDLLVLARNLLRSHPVVVAELRRRWSHLLLDEFQDTDPIQAELAMRIAGIVADPGRPSEVPGAIPDWTRLAVDPGRLFFVGDPKQAIYRFRRADIELFLRVRSMITTDPLGLTRNFRSVPGVIDTVNAVFAPLFGAGDGAVQPAFEPLMAHRAPHTGHAGVTLLGGPLDEPVAVVREAAATDTSRLIRRALAERWPVGDTGDALRPRDIAVLVPTVAELPALQRAFDDAGIAYRLETSSLVFATPAVADLRAVVRAVADPSDELTVVAALRTPLYGCGDDDLVRWKLSGGRWDPRRPHPDDASGPVADALAHLAELHRVSQMEAPPAILDRIVADLGAFALALDEPRARDTWRRLRWVVDQARAFVEAGGTDLRGWLAWTDVLADEGAKVREVALPESDDDAVRILTIHGSKGLEFPMVIVSGLCQSPRHAPTVQVLWGPEGPEIKAGRELATEGYEDRAAHEKRIDAHERIRLFYVAATRAQDHLVLPLHHKQGTDCHAARVWELLPDLGLQVTHLADTAPAVVPAPTPAPEPVLTPAERAAWVDRRAGVLARARRTHTVSPTALARAVAGHDAPPEPTTDTTDTEPWRRGRGGTALGRAVHGTLQVVDLATGEGLDEVARAQAALEGVAAAAPTVATLVRHALDAGVVRAAEGCRTWRELYVAGPVGDQVIEGFVDLLVERPDGLCIVDYKTALGASDTDLDQRAASYAVQGAAYALALEAILGAPVDRFVLLFLRLDGAVEREVTDLAAAKEQVRRALPHL